MLKRFESIVHFTEADRGRLMSFMLSSETSKFGDNLKP